MLRGPDSPGSNEDEWALCCHPSSPTQAWAAVCVCVRVCVLQSCVLAVFPATSPRLTLASKQPNQTEPGYPEADSGETTFHGPEQSFQREECCPRPRSPLKKQLVCLSRIEKKGHNSGRGWTWSRRCGNEEAKNNRDLQTHHLQA